MLRLSDGSRRMATAEVVSRGLVRDLPTEKAARQEIERSGLSPTSTRKKPIPSIRFHAFALHYL